MEDITVTSVVLATNTLGLGALTLNDHSAGDRVSYVSGSADVPISAGVQIQVPAIGNEPPILFVTTEAGTLVNGNYSSTSLSAKSVLTGKNTNIGVGQISQFTAAPPLDGALVTNTTTFTGGRNRERDLA